MMTFIIYYITNWALQSIVVDFIDLSDLLFVKLCHIISLLLPLFHIYMLINNYKLHLAYVLHIQKMKDLVMPKMVEIKILVM